MADDTRAILDSIFAQMEGGAELGVIAERVDADGMDTLLQDYAEVEAQIADLSRRGKAAIDRIKRGIEDAVHPLEGRLMRWKSLLVFMAWQQRNRTHGRDKMLRSPFGKVQTRDQTVFEWDADAVIAAGLTRPPQADLAKAKKHFKTTGELPGNTTMHTEKGGFVQANPIKETT